MFNIRQVLKSTYALIVPNDASTTTIPGWDGAKVQVLAAPAMGCEFVEYLITVNKESKVAVPIQPHPEYVFYILEDMVQSLSTEANIITRVPLRQEATICCRGINL